MRIAGGSIYDSLTPLIPMRKKNVPISFSVGKSVPSILSFAGKEPKGRVQQ